MDLIDIHNHTAWEIDDGMPSKDAAITSLVNAKKDGISMLIATPHFVPGLQDKNEVVRINTRILDLKELAKSFKIEVYLGSEVFLNHEYLEMVDNKQFNTLAGSRYILVEFDVRRNMENNDYAEDYLYELLVRGYVPVIAHVERYFPKGINLERVNEWIDLGCYIQLNRTSILGTHGDICKKNAYKLLKNGMANLIASDAHRAEGHRVCKLSDVYEIIEKEFGQENAILLMRNNPYHILHDEELEKMKINKKKSLFDRIRKRGR